MDDDKAKPLFVGLYSITQDGRLYSSRSAKYLIPNHDRYGYLYYVISIAGNRMTLKAHRLVAEAFISNPENKPTVNHKNGIRDDNRVCNLEWATVREQANDPLTRKHMLEVAANTDYRAMSELGNCNRKATAVFRDGQLLGVYRSLREAANAHQANYCHDSFRLYTVNETARCKWIITNPKQGTHGN